MNTKEKIKETERLVNTLIKVALILLFLAIAAFGFWLDVIYTKWIVTL